MKKYLYLIIFSLFLGSCFSSESDQSHLWNMPIDEFESNLALKKYNFLNEIDFDRLERKGLLDEIFRIHPGGAYYLSFIFELMDQRENSLRFLKIEMTEGQLGREAALEIYSHLSADGEWKLLSEILETYMDKTPEDYEMHSFFIEALYKSDQFSKAVSLSSPGFVSIHSLLAFIELNDDRALKDLGAFLFNGASPEEIESVYSALLRKELFLSANESERLYMLAMSSFYKGERGDVQEFLKALNLTGDTLETYPSLYYTLRLPVQDAGLEQFWGETFLEMSSFSSVFTAGRLFQWDKDYARADRAFREAITLAESDFEEDRARWYLMNLYKNNLIRLSALIEEFAPLWNDPFYFSDLLEEFLNLAVSRGEWALFDRLYPMVDLYSSNNSTAAFSWVKYNHSSGESQTVEEQKFLIDKMIAGDHMSFYNLMGTLLAGQTLQFDNYAESTSDFSRGDRLISGFLDFSLTTLAVDFTRGIERELSNEILRQVSRLALEEGDELRSIQLAGNLSLDPGQRHSLDDIKLIYPHDFGNFIDLYSDQYDFPGEILSGIIRTESAFTADIVSYAGAVGLSQLMPETAAEQARKLNIHNPDLTDPETNIHIGSAYIRWILDRDWTDNASQMLIAYNAGGGNLRKWKRLFPRYSDELFVEALPYKETRNYVRKVLTSSVVYGSLYGSRNPEDIIRIIFPDFSTIKSHQNK